jgi:hypothetical protein
MENQIRGNVQVEERANQQNRRNEELISGNETNMFFPVKTQLLFCYQNCSDLL